MDIKILKDEFGDLTDEEKVKVEDWIFIAKRIAEIRRKSGIENYVRERLRWHRRTGGYKHESEK